MKLSEAIRIGSKQNEQCLEGHYGTNENGDVTTCAMSAGAVGAGIVDVMGQRKQTGKWGVDIRTGQQTEYIQSPWAALQVYEAYSPCDCPMGKYDKEEVILTVWHLNDVHHWSREAVAEWIEVIENEIDKKTEEKPAEVANGNLNVGGEATEADEKEAVDVYDDIFEKAGK